MKNLFSIVVVFLLLQISSAFGQNQEPKELTDARNAYQADLQKAIKPVNDRYLPKLEELKKQLTYKGDIKGAVAVEDVIATLNSSQPLQQQNNSDPQELREVERNYAIEVETAIKPVKSLYIAKLEVLKQQLALNGFLKAALAVEQEMENNKTQKTHLRSSSEHKGFIKNVLSGKCIDVPGAPGTASGLKLMLWDCEYNIPNTDQKWELTSDGFIVNQLSGKCIDVPGAPGTASGLELMLWDCEYNIQNTDQKWMFISN